jgi:hypothetical protein
VQAVRFFLSASGALRIIQLYGIFARGRVDVTSVHFLRDIDPEELPEQAESGRVSNLAADCRSKLK